MRPLEDERPSQSGKIRFYPLQRCSHAGDIKTKYSPFSPPFGVSPRLRCSPCTLEEPPSIAQPPYSSVLNATTRGTFLPSLFSLSSQCRFAASRGEVVERRKQERLDEETAGKKDNRTAWKEAERQARYRCTERPQRGNDPGDRAVITGQGATSFYFRCSFSAPRNRRGKLAVFSVNRSAPRPFAYANPGVLASEKNSDV